MQGVAVQKDQLVDIGRVMVAVGRAWRRNLSARVAAVGLSEAQWSIVDNLHRSGDGVPQQVLAERMGLEKSALVRVLKALEASGEVERRDTPHDARTKQVYLTPFGRAQAQALLDIILPFEEAMIRDIPEADLRQMLSLCRLFMRRLDAEERQPEP